VTAQECAPARPNGSKRYIRTSLCKLLQLSDVANAQSIDAVPHWVTADTPKLVERFWAGLTQKRGAYGCGGMCQGRPASTTFCRLTGGALAV
jgi:hypothetical protein